MRRGWVAAAALATVLLVAPRAGADPGSWAELAKIIFWLERVDSALRGINDIVDDMKERYFLVYPQQVIRHIETLFEPVDSIKEEIERLACNWRFTPRVELLHRALFQGGSFCRSEWQLLFGPPPDTIDADLEHYYDWSAVRRLNLIKTRNEKSQRRAIEAHWLANEAQQGRQAWEAGKPYSPGYSQRLSALAAAQLGNVMVEMGDTQTAQLDLDQEAFNDKRRRRQLDHQAALTVYREMVRRGGSAAATVTEAFQ